jgi:hypothetical protein
MFSHRFFNAFPQWKGFDTGKMADLTRIVKEFHTDFIDCVCTDRNGVELPKNMGKFMIVSYKSDKMYPCFRGPRDREPLRYSNDHTDGLKCKLVFTNHDRRYRVKDRFIWSFEPEVRFKQAVSKAFRANYNMFSFSPDRMIGYKMELISKNRDAEKAQIQKFLKTYNEFAI